MADKDEKYLSLTSEIDELRYGFGVKDKSIAGLKLVGKSLFNVATFTFKEVLPAAADAHKRELEKRKK